MVDLGNLVGPSTGIQTTSSSSSAATSTTSGGTAAQTAASSGLVSIVQMKPIYVSFPVAQTMFHEVRQNQAAGPLEVDAYSQSGKLIAKGKLTVIDNQVNTSTGTVHDAGDIRQRQRSALARGVRAGSNSSCQYGENVGRRCRQAAVMVGSERLICLCHRRGPDGASCRCRSGGTAAAE